MVKLNLIREDKTTALIRGMERIKRAILRRDWEGVERLLRAVYFKIFGREI